MCAKPDSFASLMQCARFPGDLRTIAFAGCISQALADRRRPLIRGLSEERFQQLLRSCFFGVDLANVGADAKVGEGDDSYDEFEDLLGLLLDHRSEVSEIASWLCYCVASACMADRHLWQDMGLPGRSTLSSLMNECFPALAASNVGDMKWKKFLYRQLCHRAGLMICKAPNCRDCQDYAICFGPETAPVLGLNAQARLTAP